MREGGGHGGALEAIDDAAARTARAFAATQPLTRRQMLQIGAATAPLIVNIGAMAKAAMELDDLRMRRIDIPIAGLPDALDGFVIAHVSDIHVGHFTQGKILERIVEVTNAINADLAVMTGDLIDFQLRDLPPGLEVLKSIRAKNGLYVIEGNHDLFESRSHFEESVRKAGLNFLLNESVVVPLNGIKTALMGLRWGLQSVHAGGAYRENLAAVMAKRPAADFSILLSHHPDVFDDAAAHGIPLTLAGHTHGGQMMLTQGFGAGSLMFKHWSGLYQKGNSSLVVSNGVGNWMPLRVNAPAEIITITLRKAGLAP